jgi:hypothetical protein
VEAGGKKSQSLAGKAVEKANNATAAQDAQAEKLAGGVGDTPTTTITPVTPAPSTTTAPATTTPAAAATGVVPDAKALARVPFGVRQAIEKHQIVVLSVLSAKGTDDRLVRKELPHVDRLHGRVFVRSVPVRNVARYTAITRGVDLAQTPTTVVIGVDFKAVALTGWVDAKTIDQTVVDALRNARQLFTSPYLRAVDRICTTVPLNVKEVGVSTPAAFSQWLSRFGGYVGGAKRDVARLDAPAKLRGFDRATQADLAAMSGTLTSWHAALGTHPTAAKVASTLSYGRRYDSRAKALNKRMDAHDVIGCGSKS